MGGNGVEKICDKHIKSHSLILKNFPGYRDPSETKITHNHITLVTNATNTSYLNLPTLSFHNKHFQFKFIAQATQKATLATQGQTKEGVGGPGSLYPLKFQYKLPRE